MRNIIKLFLLNNDTPIGLISLGIKNCRKNYKAYSLAQNPCNNPNIFGHFQIDNKQGFRTLINLFE